MDSPFLSYDDMSHGPDHTTMMMITQLEAPGHKKLYSSPGPPSLSSTTMAPGLSSVFMRILLVSCGTLLLHSSPSTAAAIAPDPCAKIAGLTFVATADAIACQKSFPFNETLRQNVLSNIAGVFDFYTFEDYYLDSPPPFQESTTNIRAQIARMNATHYEVRLIFMHWTTLISDDWHISLCFYRPTSTSTPMCITLLPS